MDEIQVETGVDLNQDGKPDVQVKTSVSIKDPRVLAIIAIIVGVLAGTKAAGLW